MINGETGGEVGMRRRAVLGVAAGEPRPVSHSTVADAQTRHGLGARLALPRPLIDCRAIELRGKLT